jgi:RimJ/RimL family protein N-acetyltransferase
MRITTERLTLEPISLEHLKATYRYSSDLENTRLMMYLPFDSIEETKNYIRQCMEMWGSDAPEFLEFAVMRPGEHIGRVTLYLLELGLGELGWILDKRYWGNGYAAEAIRAVMEYGKRERGIRRFIAMCDSENAPSYSLMERLGMRFAGRTGGRKNRSMDGERQELTYEIFV